LNLPRPPTDSHMDWLWGSSPAPAPQAGTAAAAADFTWVIKDQGKLGLHFSRHSPVPFTVVKVSGDGIPHQIMRSAACVCDSARTY
jgi:hypothetical protein